MKKLLLLGLFALPTIAGFSQTNSQKNSLQQVTDPKLKSKVSHINFDAPKTLLCKDTIRYPQAKEQILGTSNFYSGFEVWQADNESVSQAFINTASISITGVEFFGARSTSGVASVIVNAAIYNVDANNIPTTILGSGNVTITATAYGYRYATFATPITVTGNYAVVLKPTNADGVLNLYISDIAAGQSYDELFTRFYSSYNMYPSPNTWNTIPTFEAGGANYEPLVAPIVNYSINTNFTPSVTTVCQGTPITYTNTTTPSGVFNNRMMDYQIFRTYFGLATGDSTFVYNMGNASPLIWNGTTTYTHPAAGTYNVLLATNGGFWNSCFDTKTTAITVNPLGNATFSYGSSSYCVGAANPTPTATEAGTFTSTAGLNFVSATTGQINLATSTAGTYTITHTTTGACPATSTQSITISALDNATFSYAASSYCINGANPTPTAATAGTYTSTTGIVFVSAATGQINLATSTAGTYTITHTTGGACPNTSTQTVTINALPTVAITPLSICSNAAAITLSNGTPTGGTYSGTGVTAGQFNPSAGTQPVTYSFTNGNGCTATATSTVTVTTADNASFVYSGNTFCSGSANPTPTTSAAGTFSASPAGLAFVSTSTGEINIAGSAGGSYTITHITSGACPSTSTQTVTITSSPSASFSYANAAYCVGTSNPSPIFTGGATAGTFSAPTGLAFVSTGTGVINLASSLPGTYTVTNSIAASGSCVAVSATATVTINARPTAAISGGGELCAGSTATVNITGTVTGTGPWTVTISTPFGNQTVPSATNTVTIPVGTTGAGTYSIVSVTDALCSNTGTGTATVVVNPLPVVTAASSAVCTGSAPFALSGGSPAGGTFSGTGVSAGQFDPSVGTQTVTYSYIDANGCANTATATITVNPLPTAAISGGGILCAGTTNTVDITGTLTGTGPWSVVVSTPAGNQTVPSATNTLTIPVGIIGAGTYSIVSVTDANCSNNTGSGSAVVSVNPAPTATNIPNQTVCAGTQTSVIALISTTVGTTFTWANSNTSIGLAASGNGDIPSFTASNIAGTATITITPTANGCTGSPITFIYTVIAAPTATFTTPTTVCVYSSTITLSGTPSGGVFSGNGVIGSNFNPGTAGLGTHTITYSVIQNGCGDSATSNIEVSACASIEDIIANNGLAIYPNPSNGNVTFEFSNTEINNVNLSVVSTEGKTVYQNNFQTAKATIDLSTLARGTYFVRVTMNGKTSTSKLILE